MMKLSRNNLARLPETVKRPHYSLAELKPGIVHIGLGNFHRAHQSWYLHRLMQQGEAYNWGIIGAGVRTYDSDMRARLIKQDYLTTLVELDPEGHSAEVVGSMVDYTAVTLGNAPLIKQMAMPTTRIVSLTVTEGGYYRDADTGGFDAQHPDILHDTNYPEQPNTAFGAIVAALKLRREQGYGPFTCQSCDNILGNGTVLLQTITALARLTDPELADWIDAKVSFPNSMVDCIVPATGYKARKLVSKLGITDSAPVTHENFRQWVIEDKFCAGRPALEKVGAVFSNKVHTFEAQKVRILNAGHQLVANSADILGIKTVSAAMAQPNIRAFFRKTALTEIVPHILPVPDMTPEQYVDLIDRRFANIAIGDTIQRVAFDGSSRHPGFVLPSVRDALKHNTALNGLALAEAAWARACLGVREDGSKIEANDPQWNRLMVVAAEARIKPSAWLSMRNIYGDLADNSRFAQQFEQWLHIIYGYGIEHTIKLYLSDNH